ncbi:nitrate/nitrite two-component system sensor histidine kinase NarQ [Pectobacterium brasiliense]|uniref:nitrate/nitrite two-component system sensor histidine kinase NarQ n=1 Tax=Pectobacterium brasiliense TaxID=180957 RepID=UPI00094A2BB8|nr:nitrate/nitrite two-component system sensor histidine kinase NarQ [Pectobacterium brasiliense]APS30494.1 nitrate/nitrite sensor protein NarQ [Pectobacterium brasiliense]MBN3098321.1 nitrate/nitrite two-component system sensor histidine kinase NarQ [Pectobacterium brasiliense]MBN3101117.1 nitrate/nitrite two-component system sensor histidine kinase NarQ [Pectobacterium brasiliense]MBN3167348.1 nitrate/nitrite two-component system sensor histidine kinase NarQ [Pectobacterium brasiliense]
MVKRPVSTSLARAFFYIALLSFLTTGIALLTLASGLRDAEAINVAGSMRMQSYRMGYDLQGDRAELASHRRLYAQTLDSPVFHLLDRWYVPRDVRDRYAALLQSWKTMDERLNAGDRVWYQDNIVGYVTQIDRFVLALQHYSERKMMIVVVTSIIGSITIYILIFFTLRRIRRQVVVPLNKLMAACASIEKGRFTHSRLDVNLPNELGLLAQTFSSMTDELQKLYRSLEDKVRQKTLRLQEVNRMLKVLYNCSQAMNVSTIDRHCFQQILQIVRRYETVDCLEMRVGENWRLCEGQPDEQTAWQALPICLQDVEFGQLRWQASTQQPSAQLMESVANMLGRGLYFNQAQKHYQQLLLMEERATIARELHDSLAQVLSYLNIQMTLLKRAVAEENAQARQIITDFEQALSDAYRQLRELLGTFRLTLQQADLPAAMQEMIEPLRAQTPATITIDCRIPTQALDASQQVHLLQIIREAVLNAIKHAQATAITVNCRTQSDGRHCVDIRDDGCGIINQEEPAGHYGLNIMQERAERLGGKLSIGLHPEGGTQVSVCFSTPTTARERDNTNNLYPE